jgi:hypothetical protein
VSGQSFGIGGSYGIYNSNVDESCREAYNMVQVIRHEFWKANPKRSSITVDSSVDSWIKDKIEIYDELKFKIYTYI